MIYVLNIPTKAKVKIFKSRNLCAYVGTNVIRSKDQHENIVTKSYKCF